MDNHCMDETTPSTNSDPKPMDFHRSQHTNIMTSTPSSSATLTPPANKPSYTSTQQRCQHFGTITKLSTKTRMISSKICNQIPTRNIISGYFTQLTNKPTTKKLSFTKFQIICTVHNSHSSNIQTTHDFIICYSTTAAPNTNHTNKNTINQ